MVATAWGSLNVGFLFILYIRLGVIHSSYLRQNCGENKRETKEFRTLFGLLNIGHFEVVTGCDRVT